MALTTVDPLLLSTQSQYTGFKSRIINGGMVIAQRGTSFATPASFAYTLDRWFITWAGAAPASVAQVTGPTGFRNALQITGAASNTQTILYQRIESFNCSDLSGQSVTIQANIAASFAQTVYWQLAYPNTQDNYAGATIISSGTWSVTTTATTFSATITNLPSSATNGLQLLISPNNLGAFTSGTLTVTGVQLEKGTQATSFDYRPYGTELALCQRYLPAISSTSTSDYFDFGQSNAATNAYGHFNFVVTPRVPPTGIVVSSASHITVVNPAGVTMVGTSVVFSVASFKYARWVVIGSGGLTTAQPAEIYFNNASAYLYFTGCEL